METAELALTGRLRACNTTCHMEAVSAVIGNKDSRILERLRFSLSLKGPKPSDRELRNIAPILVARNIAPLLRISPHLR
jgi:hypothetical protein